MAVAKWADMVAQGIIPGASDPEGGPCSADGLYWVLELEESCQANWSDEEVRIRVMVRVRVRVRVGGIVLG